LCKDKILFSNVYHVTKLNSIVEKISAKHPEWYEKNNALISEAMKNL